MQTAQDRNVFPGKTYKLYHFKHCILLYYYRVYFILIVGIVVYGGSRGGGVIGVAPPLNFDNLF